MPPTIPGTVGGTAVNQSVDPGQQNQNPLVSPIRGWGLAALKGPSRYWDGSNVVSGCMADAWPVGLSVAL